MGGTIRREPVCPCVCVNLDRQADFGGRVLDGGSEVAWQNYILHLSLAHTLSGMAKSLVYGVAVYPEPNDKIPCVVYRKNLTNLVRIVYQYTPNQMAKSLVYSVAVYLDIVKH